MLTSLDSRGEITTTVCQVTFNLELTCVGLAKTLTRKITPIKKINFILILA